MNKGVKQISVLYPDHDWWASCLQECLWTHEQLESLVAPDFLQSLMFDASTLLS